MNTAHQLDLFKHHSLNPTYEIKRQIRMALADSSLSRDEIVDLMNEISTREGMRKSVSKAILDNWCKDSDVDRLPSPAWITIFCHVTGSTAPIGAMVLPLGAQVIIEDDVMVLKWANAELDKKRAVKKARLALEAIE